VDLRDVDDPPNHLSELAEYYRNKVIDFGRNLRNTGSLTELIEDIMSDAIFGEDDMRTF
jgi:hypothetical protein